MINNKHIGQKLKELRNSRGWKQTEVADMVGLSRPAISNIESGKRALTLSTLKRFCESINRFSCSAYRLYNKDKNFSASMISPALQMYYGCFFLFET